MKVTIALAVVAAAFLFIANAAARYELPPDIKKPCYSKALWTGNEAERPCWRLRINPDGSGSVWVDGYRYSIPGPPPVSGCDHPSNPCDDYPSR